MGRCSMVGCAGLWKEGRGTVRTPNGSVFFLPQQPFMPLGSLRQQLLFPSGELALSVSVRVPAPAPPAPPSPRPGLRAGIDAGVRFARLMTVMTND